MVARVYEKTQGTVITSSDPLSSYQSNAVTKNSLNNYYSLLKETLEKNKLMNISSCIGDN